jgi:hypothetical protein
MPSCDKILSKPSFHRYVPDFAAGVQGMSIRRWTWTLVEIEPSDVQLFTGRGDPSAKLTHAVRQISDWRNWITENSAYARSILPDITPTCQGLIVIGRRKEITPQVANQLRAYQACLSAIQIHTYDWLYDNIDGIAEQSSRNLSICNASQWQRELDWDG